MTRRKIIVAALDEETSAADEVKQRLAGALSDQQKPTIDVVAADDLDPTRISQPAAVVLVCRSDIGQNMVLPLLTALEEAAVPVLALLDEEPGPKNPFSFAGAVVQTRSADPLLLAGILDGMLHRQKVIVQLHKDVALANRFHGGLEGEIARMHEELQLASIVQREFLPREIPSLHGVGLAALWRPAGYVSGDIYDITRLDHDHIGVFIADAVGHGVPAALMTMVIVRSLCTKETEDSSYRIIPPREVLARLNADLIARQARTNRFVTAVYAVINCRSRVLTLAGAGHPSPIYMNASGETELLETPGGLLGVFEDESYDQIERELAVDDRILFYSDGFEQAFPEADADPYKRRLPTKRYLTEFEQLAKLSSATEMIETMDRRLDAQAGSLHRIDDLSLICLHAGPLEEAKKRYEGTKARRHEVQGLRD